jgi:hypothetical protein
LNCEATKKLRNEVRHLPEAGDKTP